MDAQHPMTCETFSPEQRIIDTKNKDKGYMTNIFWNRQEHRIKAGWRIIVFTLLYTACLSTIVVLRLAFGRTAITSFTGILALFGATAVALWFASRFIDHRHYRDFGLGFDRKWWLDLISGFLIGALLLATVFAIEYALGWVEVTQLFKNEKDAWINFPFVPTLLIALLAHTGTAFLEEILFRGYMMKNLAEGFHGRRVNSKKAVILAFATSSLLFALFHLSNPNISIFAIVHLILAGLLLGALFLLTGEIALSIGLHISWNFFMGVVFGFPISGTSENIAVVATRQSGPTLWTGGTFGPEGGLLGIFAIIAGCVLTILWVIFTRRRLSISHQLADYSRGDKRSTKQPTA